MRGAFDEDEVYERQRHQAGGDAEFTLGAGTLLLMFVGLLVLCGICFGAGYMVGHRGPSSAAEARQTADATTAPSGNSPGKPSATPQAAAAPAQPQQADTAAQPAVTDPTQTPAAGGAAPVPPPQNTNDATQSQVRPALPTATQPQPVNPYPSRPAGTPAPQQVRPAMQQPAVQLWVQIAAVSHVEDAQVLTRALEKHGYTVTARREADNLIHVRIGPFSSRDEATRWRAKLLDDGYNAEIQQ